MDSAKYNFETKMLCYAAPIKYPMAQGLIALP